MYFHELFWRHLNACNITFFFQNKFNFNSIFYYFFWSNILQDVYNTGVVQIQFCEFVCISQELKGNHKWDGGFIQEKTYGVKEQWTLWNSLWSHNKWHLHPLSSGNSRSGVFPWHLSPWKWAWEATNYGLSAWVPVSYWGEIDGVPGFWLLPVLALEAAEKYRMNPRMGHQTFSL